MNFVLCAHSLDCLASTCDRPDLEGPTSGYWVVKRNAFTLFLAPYHIYLDRSMITGTSSYRSSGPQQVIALKSSAAASIPSAPITVSLLPRSTLKPRNLLGWNEPGSGAESDRDRYLQFLDRRACLAQFLGDPEPLHSIDTLMGDASPVEHFFDRHSFLAVLLVHTPRGHDETVLALRTS